MGLRINTNQGALGLLRQIGLNQAREIKSLERLATGLKVNRASDNPSAFVALTQLTQQLLTTEQAIENTQRGINLIDTAEAGLSEIGNILTELRGLAVQAGNTGVLSQEQLGALQQTMDAGISAISRIVSTTRFGDQPLLNGALAIQTTGASPELKFINLSRADVEPGTTVTVEIVSAATQATVSGTLAAGGQAATTTVRIRGPLGTEEITVQAGTSQAGVIDAINSVKGFTGVEATSAGVVRSVDFGSQAFVQIEVVSGPGLTGLDLSAGNFFKGTDVVANVEGQSVQGQGNTIVFSQPSLAGEIIVKPGVTGTFQFTVEGGGATFQTGPTSGAADRVTIGIRALGAGSLGETSGLGGLSTLATGGANSLTNPAGAISVLEAAAREVNALRGQLGSVSSELLERNVTNLRSAFENIAASRSRLGDTDFAEEAANAMRARLLRQAGIFTLRNFNQSQGSILNLLA